MRAERGLEPGLRRAKLGNALCAHPAKQRAQGGEAGAQAGLQRVGVGPGARGLRAGDEARVHGGAQLRLVQAEDAAVRLATTSRNRSSKWESGPLSALPRVMSK